MLPTVAVVDRIVYIVSLPHSGSTLLNLMLGAGSGTLALGEISLTRTSLDSERQNLRICSCGEPMSDCPLWGPVVDKFNRSDNQSYLDFYQDILDQARLLYGANINVIESSKTLGPLEELRGRFGATMSTIYLLRDVRGHVYASRRRLRSGNVSFGFAGLEAMKWYRQNRAIKVRLDRSGFPYFQMGYEELCASPSPVIQELSGFTGVAFDPGTSKPTLENSHVLRGNRMRRNKNKMAGIRYDDRWRSDPWLRRTRWMIWPFLPWNRKNVYGNAVAAPLDWVDSV